jgi:hypothetical protein
LQDKNRASVIAAYSFVTDNDTYQVETSCQLLLQTIITIIRTAPGEHSVTPEAPKREICAFGLDRLDSRCIAALCKKV